MSKPTLYGYAIATYVRTARIALIEKGVDYDLEPIKLGSPEHLRLHPFGKMPVLRHDDAVLYETLAICLYVDDVFDGPALQPSDSLARARMCQWISVISDYVYAQMVNNLARQYFIVPLRGGEPDMKLVTESLPAVKQQIDLIEETLAAHPYLAGETYSLADMFLEPILYWVARTPEGAGMLAGREAIGRWRAALAARPAIAATVPPPVSIPENR